MSLPIRLEKLRFIIAELQLGLHLARHAPDDFVARTLARHVAIRAENFIVHARRLRTPLNQLGIDTRAFHKTKEVYAEFFDEYFHVVRDRLGAHVQDVDFGRRIELWNDIEIVKSDFFVGGAKEIYDNLAAANIPGYVPYTEPAALTDTGLLSSLEAFKGSGETRPWTELATDPLAMTRPNTTSMLNMTTVHARAGQLVLIRRWIAAQQNLMARVQGYEDVTRLLKARIVTDIVSFFDGLVTRAVPAGASQQMDGLDTLLVGSGVTNEVINQFGQVFATARVLDPARKIRDRLGAHIESDEAITLSTLLHELDNFDLDSGVTFFDRLTKVFEKVCSEVLFLRTYAADGQRIYGVTANSMSVIPFDEAEPPAAVPSQPKPDYDDEAVYQAHLTQWMTGDEHGRQDARYYFWQAFLSADVVESIDEIEELGAGSRSARHHVRKVHRFMVDALCAYETEASFVKLLELLLACRSGDPHMLAEVLIRYHAAVPHPREWQCCYALGELASWPHAGVQRFLIERGTNSPDRNLQFQSLLALFKIYARTEGLARTNGAKPFRSYARDIAPIVSTLPDERKLLCIIAFASQRCHHGLGHVAQALTPEFDLLASEIEVLCKSPVFADIGAPVVCLVANLQRAHDYVGVCLALADAFTASGRTILSDDLLISACAGWVVPAQHDAAARNLAACFLRRKEFALALQIADQLAARHPHDVDLQIFAAQIALNSPAGRQEAGHRIAGIQADYKLTQAQNDTLVAFEAYRAENSEDGNAA